MIFDHPEENYCYSGKNRNNDYFNQTKKPAELHTFRRFFIPFI